MKSFSYLSESCKDNKEEKKDNEREYYNNMEKDENSTGNNMPLNAKSDINSNVNFIKLRKVEKRVGAIVKSNLDKIPGVKLMSDFVANYLVDIMFLKNLIFNISDKTNIADANFLADLITNFFVVISPINSFVAFIGFSIKNDSFGILILANFTFISVKSFINNFVALIASSAIVLVGIAFVGSFVIALVGLFIEVNMLGNFFANI